ncbi:MAG TPA: TIGR03560 family F420-dependent LLM class oxidoreductase [Candidatus Caenarcaniphilales bacterium]|nr:TIGR03560 family F420-dependent LLM class oxidoreductase [Candidatus Caenarcaniphilales bacterium]
MNIGVIVPQGWTGEYDGWNAADAWARTRDVAWQAEALGFESIWLFDHFHTTPEPTDEMTFESFTALSALAAETRRVRLGHVVMCAAYRNPALTAKMVSTLDVISGGRMELGLGAGWKRDEWLAYGYGFPPARQRLAILRDQLEVAHAMMGPGRATYAGEHVQLEGAINLPKPLQQPRVPIMVGGNGAEVTWRLAARYADELNLDAMPPADVAKATPVIASRCEEIGRDPASLRVSVHVWWQQLGAPGPHRADLVAAYRDVGVSRLIALVRESADSDEALAAWADSAREGGAVLAESHAVGA